MTRRYLAGSPTSGAVDEAFAEVRASFDRFCLAAGIEALGTMMEADVTAACGPRHGRDAARRAHRWGRTRGRIGFHGGKIEVERPRSKTWTAASPRSRAGKRRRRRIGLVVGR